MSQSYLCPDWPTLIRQSSDCEVWCTKCNNFSTWFVFLISTTRDLQQKHRIVQWRPLYIKSCWRVGSKSNLQQIVCSTLGPQLYMQILQKMYWNLALEEDARLMPIPISAMIYGEIENLYEGVLMSRGWGSEGGRWGGGEGGWTRGDQWSTHAILHPSWVGWG